MTAVLDWVVEVDLARVSAHAEVLPLPLKQEAEAKALHAPLLKKLPPPVGDRVLSQI